MAYVLTSFVQIREQDVYHLILDMKTQIDPLLEKARFLRDLFVENLYSITSIEKENMESRMRDVVHKAEDLIESYIRDKDQASQLELTGVIEEFDSIKEELLRLVSIGNVQADDPLIQTMTIASSTDPVTSLVNRSTKNIVGIEVECRSIILKIQEGSSKLETMSIVGMAGIGKTTLAWKFFCDPCIQDDYKTCAWVTVSKEYNVQEILLALLKSLGHHITNEMRREKYNKLGKLVHDILKHKKYLVVLDDVWDLEAWDKIIPFFPKYGHSSRIIATTRFREVAVHVSHPHLPLEIPFMTNAESFDLMSYEVFGNLHGHPFEWNLLGRRIAKMCGGHPLVLKLVAGILVTSEKTVKFWELVAENLLVLQQPYVDILYVKSIILMCYNHLSHYLKPCLLYMGAFPEDYGTSASTIVKMWIAEGLVEPIAGKGLEDTAELYLRGLVEKNFLHILQGFPTGRIKTFGIHDLLREFCQEEAIEKDFLWYKYSNGANIQQNEEVMRRVSVSALSRPGYSVELMSLVRSYLCIGFPPLRLAPKFVGLSLLRVLDVFGLEYYQFPAEILHLELLRYLAFSCHSYMPPSISRLQNLQTLIIRRLPSFRAFSLPPELWKLAQLRHVKSKETCTCYFPTDGNHYIVQENLQTLTNVQMVGLTNEFLGKFPNMRKLGIFGNITMDNVIDLARLHKLEKLRCSSDWSLAARNFLSFLTFPPSLKKLTLRLCKIPLGFMATIGSLPNLEQLKLQESDFLGAIEPEWVPKEGEFTSLISLHMEDLNLVHWKAHSTHFPILKHLSIQRCPITHVGKDIGNITTIQHIKVDIFSPSLLDSVMELEGQMGTRVRILPIPISL